jgi:methylmalonyl-CoA mutase cobalamin-binding subunit
MGVTAVFGPGANTTEIIQTIENEVGARRKSRETGG